MSTPINFMAFLAGLVLLGGCKSVTNTTPQASNTPVSTTPVTTTTTPTVAPVLDSLKWVNYLANDLRYDTTLFSGPKPVGEITDVALVEASGLAPSRQNPGYLWTEEDSGNPNQIQLLSATGAVVARYTMTGLANRDWEDIAVGAGPVAGQPYVYLAEIGDNKLRYPTKTIYRFPEPSIAGKVLPANESVAAADAINLQLPDGPKNAEAILVDPLTLDIYVLSKEDRCIVYRAAYPQSLTEITTMQRLLAIPYEKVTSASISADGRQILIRTYGELYYYTRLAGETIVDALKRPPLKIPIANEPQGEAVGWSPDGLSYYTTSEKPDAQPQVIYRYSRKQ